MMKYLLCCSFLCISTTSVFARRRHQSKIKILSSKFNRSFDLFLNRPRICEAGMGSEILRLVGNESFNKYIRSGTHLNVNEETALTLMRLNNLAFTAKRKGGKCRNVNSTTKRIVRSINSVWTASKKERNDFVRAKKILRRKLKRIGKVMNPNYRKEVEKSHVTCHAITCAFETVLLNYKSTRHRV